MSQFDILNVLHRDLPEPFIASLQDTLCGEYAKAYEDVAQPAGGFVTPRPNSEWDSVDLRAVRNSRRNNGLRALLRTCREHGVPFEVKSLACNGQTIVVGQIGQILIMTEPIDNLSARPEPAVYKLDLAASHFAIRQLELDLGDGWRQRIDPRNTMLVVIQHGMRIGGFNRRDTALAMMRLVVPDSAFGSWLFKANVLNGELDFALNWSNCHKAPTDRPVQIDRVAVTLKKRPGEKEIGR